MKLQGIRLLTEKFDEAFNFYSEILDGQVVWGKPGEVYASFKIGPHLGLSIFKADLMDSAIGVKIEENRRLADTAVLIIDTDNLDALYESLFKKGIVFETPPHDMPGWGNRCAHLRDPDGNLIELSTSLDKDKWSEDLKQASKEYE